VSATPDRGGPLAGVRVLELTKVWAGPYAGKLLAFLGAEVIRVESRGSLDVTRTFGVDDIDAAPGFQSVNPQKLSVTIDMKSAGGLALLKDLAATCDIVIENLRPGSVRRLGLGYEALRAVRTDIILVSMGMYGSDGPLAWQTGYAPCFAALGGVTALVGYPGEAPVGMNVRYADSSFGAAAAYAALIALNHRERTGEGQFVDVAAVETMASMVGDSLIGFAVAGRAAVSDGNRHPDMAPHGIYPCAGGEWIAIAAQDDAAWRALAEAMRDAALGERHPTLDARRAAEDEIDAAIAVWSGGRDAREIEAELQQRGVAAAKSQSSIDLVADAHLWQRGFYREVVDGAGLAKTIVGAPWRMSRPAAIEVGAPRLGEHNAYVFGELLGLSAEGQQRLADDGAIR
jgi:crotonobetainyl-CoA:carnitine CoA-transferase CaiB-like acyl-CoA transferase